MIGLCDYGTVILQLREQSVYLFSDADYNVAAGFDQYFRASINTELIF